MDVPSDEALLAGLASGDADEAAAFVRRFQRRVYGLALTILRDADLADDVAQETFVRAWRHAAGYDPRRGQVAAWLLTIARNVAIDRAGTRRIPPADPDVIASRLELATTDAIPVITNGKTIPSSTVNTTIRAMAGSTWRRITAPPGR